MKNILFIYPSSGNGGIRSWAKEFLSGFFTQDYHAIGVSASKRRSTLGHGKGFLRAWDGMLDTLSVYKDTRNALRNNSIDLMHITSSGNVGTLRDYLLVNICHRYNVPCILHCHYGCIPSDFAENNFWGRLLRNTLRKYDEIWVLDRNSERALKEDSKLKNKVYVTPNSISVPDTCDLSPKEYKNIAFVGNLIPAKGLFELVHAVADYDLNVDLTIAGPGTDNVINEIKRISGEKFGNSIKYVGQLPNEKAIALIKSMDMIALPSYYPSEAFPISIIEAMSYGKLVVSTKRAAIPDMLTDIDGNECGYFVREQSVEDIVGAIKWCQDNPQKADMRCAKAYEKVKACYSTEVVYKMYRDLYDKIYDLRIN